MMNFLKSSMLVLLTTTIIIVGCVRNQKSSDKNVQIPLAEVEALVIAGPKDALEELKNGNLRFMANQLINTDYENQIEATKELQKPHSVILSCMDSRVPPEIIFDQGIGNVFVIRNAGNIEDENVLGSMEYAVEFAGSKLIVVMGHSHCGAVTGAIKNVEAGNLTQLVNQIKPSIPEDRTSPHLVEETAKNNVSNTIDDVLERSEIIKKLRDSGQIKIVGAFYDIETGEVVFVE